ncbi:BrnA antitoxin family protein [Ancylobacter sp. 6x-1]|uniref:BrnA antitoxin family protein n=1 Tax=Ancylobacter crimeensis TaxID=2579147 RepID=A0ABT0DAA3_9HYPH|nr:BrnA antitoxin family protein [Ancylobacter crimeensis]MCK0196889.1 BrnA antitoxin family protein [Ancylobacter crimeensis]
MTRKPAKSSPVWVDPDDAPEWTEDQLDRAELAEGGKVLRPAQGTLTRGRGRPKIDKPKEQVSVRLDPDVLSALRSGGPGWQVRMNEALRKALGI